MSTCMSMPCLLLIIIFSVRASRSFILLLLLLFQFAQFVAGENLPIVAFEQKKERLPSLAVHLAHTLLDLSSFVAPFLATRCRIAVDQLGADLFPLRNLGHIHMFVVDDISVLY